MDFFRKMLGLDGCYLKASNLFSKKTLEEDSEALWSDMLRETDLDGEFRYLISNFFIPYRISCMKFMFNQEAFESPELINPNYQLKHIAPSLRIFIEDPYHNVSLGYPNWFYEAFPEVVVWIRKNAGRTWFETKFKNYSDDDLIENNHLKTIYLKEIIDKYLQVSGKELECKRYS